jgi:hypothetical protein
MKIDLALDYQSILRNEPRPVHLVANSLEKQCRHGDKTPFSDAGNNMRKFKITYVRPHGDSTWLYITVEAPSYSAAKEIAQSMLTGMKILNVAPVS